MLTAQKGSISGMKQVEKKILDTMHDRGMGFITKDNLQRFGEYMEYIRSINKGRQYDSESAADLFKIAESKGLDTYEVMKDFDFWNEHAEQLENTPKPRNKENRTADEYRRRMAQNDAKRKNK